MTHDPLDTNALAEHREEQKAAAKHKAEQALLDIEWLMLSVQGRRIVWRLLEITGVYRSSYTGDNDTFFKEGARNVGLILMADIQRIAPDQFTLMLKEHN